MLVAFLVMQQRCEILSGRSATATVGKGDAMDELFYGWLRFPLETMRCSLPRSVRHGFLFHPCHGRRDVFSDQTPSDFRLTGLRRISISPLVVGSMSRASCGTLFALENSMDGIDCCQLTADGLYLSARP